MPNTYTQLHIQIVFSVFGRLNSIAEIHRDELQKYICGIISNLNCKPIALYCNPDHTHILIGLCPDKSLSEIVRIIKANSSKFINEKKWTLGNFQWQSGYGAFSYSKSQVENVIKYILSQKEHHKKISFREEYLLYLKKYEIEYDDKYLFQFID